MFCRPVVESGNVNVRSFTAIVGSGIFGQIYVLQALCVVTFQRHGSVLEKKRMNVLKAGTMGWKC